MTTFDLNILPIHRFNGQDLSDLPGLYALTPPRRTARGREKDNLILHLMFSGNASFSNAEIKELNKNAAQAFYQSAGTLTSAMRKATETINNALLARNLSTTGRGQYALGLLTLAVIREDKVTLLLSGPTHVVSVNEGQARHIHDPALSGKGLGSSQSFQSYFSQVDLRPNNLLVLCGIFPRDWEADLLGERPTASLEASYRKLTLTKGDLNAALIQPQHGQGIITILHAEISTPRHTQPQPASVPQTVPAPTAIAQPEKVEDALIESPQSFREDSRNAQPTFGNYPSITDTNKTDTDSPASDSPTTSITEEELDELAEFAAHLLQPSAYAIPPQSPESFPPFSEEKSSTPLSATTSTPSIPRSFPPSIPRIQAVETKTELTPETIEDDGEEVLEEEVIIDEVATPRSERRRTRPILDGLKGLSLFYRPKEAAKSDAHAVATRQMAKVMVSGIQSGRRVNERMGTFLRRFVPRLLPGVEGQSQQQMFSMPTYALIFIAVVIPALVVTVALVVYLRFGQSVQYDDYYAQARGEQARALSETDPARQREAWQSVLNLLDKAESYRKTNDADTLRSQAQSSLDTLMGVMRLEFVPAFANGLNNNTQVSRMAASESDLYMLDAERGNILHASFTGRSLELDTAFACQPGSYAGYQVGPLLDLLALPKINAVGATVLGIDSTGTLLYCSPGQVPQAIPLPPLPNTNWGHIVSFALDSGNLYVLDATSRSVWVFPGKDSAFVDTPYFYFGNQIPNSIENAIDLSVSGDDLYLLHGDGHLSTCTFSRIAETPTRCIDPVNYQDPFPAHQDINLFVQANFTQMSLTTPPNSVLLLLDSENQKIFRFTPRSLELQNQITSHSGDGNPFDPVPVSAMTVSPNYVLYLAIGNQVYFATNLP